MTGQDRIDQCRCAERVHDLVLHELTPSRLNAGQIKEIAVDVAALVQQRIEEALEEQ